jgi:hypothetical protein
MHQAPEPLGEALLLRSEGGNASVDLSLADAPFPSGTRKVATENLDRPYAP